jgi:WD40 repeat protein
VNDIAWASNSRFLASASDDTTIKLWDRETVRCHWFLATGRIRPRTARPT